MYVKRIHLVNYGPIEKLNIEFPFKDNNPKPVLLVGENGSGKSILLSHIVNGLISAKGIAYPDTPEVDPRRVYKLRSSSYIKSGKEYYFGRVEFGGDLFASEINTNLAKQEYATAPVGIPGTAAEGIWNKLKPADHDCYDTNITARSNESKIKKLFAENCVLYFPFNRFEEPAWLNEENLKAQAQHTGMKHIEGQTARKVISYSPLHDNQNWLFGVIYDSAVFDIQTKPVTYSENGNVQLIAKLVGYSGQATKAYLAALQIVQGVTGEQGAGFTIGRRNNRAVGLESDTQGLIIPKIFQLSSGETSLLNMFLSILRDFDMCGSQFLSAADIRGIVVVDEVDLHLHAVHQHEILPKLIKMFPKVQFVVTTHSPLFVLGMRKEFGEDGFALYRLPQGRQISPEEFGEFENAYKALSETSKFLSDVQMKVGSAQKPILFVEGETDQKYIQRAAQLLSKETVLQKFNVWDGGGSGNLGKIWKNFRPPLTDIITQKVLLLFDCDEQRKGNRKGKLFQRILPLQDATNNPIQEGIENLFNTKTLKRAQKSKPTFFDIDHAHSKTKRGTECPVLEKWTVNKDEKTNLCNWLCKNGNQKDFRGFQVIFEILEEVLASTPSS